MVSKLQRISKVEKLPQERTCPNCGFVLEDQETRFCRFCGASLEQNSEITGTLAGDQEQSHGSPSSAGIEVHPEQVKSSPISEEYTKPATCSIAGQKLEGTLQLVASGLMFLPSEGETIQVAYASMKNVMTMLGVLGVQDQDGRNFTFNVHEARSWAQKINELRRSQQLARGDNVGAILSRKRGNPIGLVIFIAVIIIAVIMLVWALLYGKSCTDPECFT